MLCSENFEGHQSGASPCVRSNFLTLIVRLTISFILSFITQVDTTGTSSGLSRKVWVTAYKSDAY